MAAVIGGCSSAWLECRSVTPEVAGSSPVSPVVAIGHWPFAMWSCSYRIANSQRPKANSRSSRPGGEIGRHAILRGWCRKASRFESAPGHERQLLAVRHRQRWSGVSSVGAVANGQRPMANGHSRHSSSGVEHSIRNRAVVGSIPTCGSRSQGRSLRRVPFFSLRPSRAHISPVMTESVVEPRRSCA
jgi:hypothetical protein